MVVGVVLGLTAPGLMQGLRSLEFGAGSQINVPIAILIWLMITPMMMKVDFGSIRNVGRRPRGLFVTLFVNWLVKPFSMAAIAWLFFRYVFSPWISPADADQYRRQHHSGRRALHRDGVRLELPDRRRSVHAGAGLGQRPADAGAVCADRDVPGERRLLAPCPLPGAALLGAGLHRRPADRRVLRHWFMRTKGRAWFENVLLRFAPSAWRPCSPRSC